MNKTIEVVGRMDNQQTADSFDAEREICIIPIFIPQLLEGNMIILDGSPFNRQSNI